MASERWPKAGVGSAVAVLMALAACAARVGDSPRLLVLCGIGMLLAGLVLWRCLARLTLRRPLPEAAAPPRHGDAQATANALLALEARLEHAPIALFTVAQPGDPAAVAPLNGNARRLLAPGRAVDGSSQLQCACSFSPAFSLYSVLQYGHLPSPVVATSM